MTDETQRDDAKPENPPTDTPSQQVTGAAVPYKAHQDDAPSSAASPSQDEPSSPPEEATSVVTPHVSETSAQPVEMEGPASPQPVESAPEAQPATSEPVATTPANPSFTQAQESPVEEAQNEQAAPSVPETASQAQPEPPPPHDPAPAPAAKAPSVPAPAPSAAPVPEPTSPEPREHLEQLLLDLAAVARKEGMRSLATEISKHQLSALREGRITAIVLGEFNHGKSTLLNALLGGEDILPMGITPTTAQITHLRYADRPEAIVHYDDSDRVHVSVHELAEHVAQDVDVEPQYVEVGYPAPLLKDNLVLVDTPGVNDISRQRVEITYGYLPRADVIIYVLDANQVLKQSEITFIQNRLLRSNRDRLLFVLGKIDTLNEDEREEVETYARERLTELVGRVEIYPLSARRALNDPESDPGFLHFRDHLLHYLRDSRAFILIDSGVGGGLRVAGMLLQNLAIKRRGYALDRAELERRVAAVKARIKDARRAISQNLTLIDDTTKGLKATARHNIREFTERFTEALPREIERSTTEDIKKYLPDWIRDTYKEWLEQEGNAIARELERLAEEVIETTNRNLGEAVDAVQDELGLRPQGVDLEIDTMPYDVGVIAVGALGLSVAVFGSILAGGLLILAAPVMAFMFKDKVEEKLRVKALESGQRAIIESGERVEAEMIRVIDDHGEQLKTF
ncbi:MAG: dynamin family protein, partial [Myxococcota bacterium]